MRRIIFNGLAVVAMFSMILAVFGCAATEHNPRVQNDDDETYSVWHDDDV